MSEKYKPSVFIGSSVESLDLAYAVQSNLDYDAEVTVWDQGVFDLSKSAMESLQEVLAECDFGVFVFAPEDVTKIRGHDLNTVRDNVIMEFGMFAGRLGRERCFMLRPRGAANMHLPTDLLGLTPAEYDPNRSDGRTEAAVGRACGQIKKAIHRLRYFSPEEEAWNRLHIAKHFPPNRSASDVSGLWLSKFDFRAYRGKRYVTGKQIDLEHLSPVGGHSLWGRNLLHASSHSEGYSHELRFRVLGSFLLGVWFNQNSTNLGGVQLHIHSVGNVLTGAHIGNANNNQVESGRWEWIRIKNSNLSPDEVRALASRSLRPFADLDSKFPAWLKRAYAVDLDNILLP